MKNHKLKTYIKKQLNYSPLQTIAPEPFYNGYEMKISDLTFEEVKVVMRELSKPSTWITISNIFETCFRMPEKDFYEGRVLDYFKARNYIVKTFNRLIETEIKLLSSLQDLDSAIWEQAGGKRLNRHGAVLSINQLGKIYGIYPFDLKDKKYQEILLLLTIEKEQREIQKKYDKLKSNLKPKK